MRDYGGTSDILDLRPWESSDVHFEASNADGADPSNDSLYISAGDRAVLVWGQLAPIADQDENGKMEKIIFADETITSASKVRTLMKASSDISGRTAAPEALAAPSPEDLLE